MQNKNNLLFNQEIITKNVGIYSFPNDKKIIWSFYILLHILLKELFILPILLLIKYII